MQREPLYEFVKGEGWVIRNNRLTMACGTEVEWELRLPKPYSEERYKRVPKDIPISDIPLFLVEGKWLAASRARQGSYTDMSTRYNLVVLHRVSDTPHDPDE